MDLIKGVVTLVTISATMQCEPNVQSALGNVFDEFHPMDIQYQNTDSL